MLLIYLLTRKEFRELVNKYNLKIVQAHTFRKGCHPKKVWFLDGIEVYNGNKRYDSRNELALAYAKKMGLEQIKGSDFHRPEDLQM